MTVKGSWSRVEDGNAYRNNHDAIFKKKMSKDPWIRTYTGGRVYFFHPEQSEFTIEDVAHALSLVCRFNGACKEFYSVAQHSCLIHDYLPDHLKFQGLMHDSSEAFLSDIPKPFKSIFEGYKEAEDRFEKFIAKKFGYEFPYDTEIKIADTRMLVTEMRDLMLVSDADSINSEPYSEKIEVWSPSKAKQEFLRRYENCSDKQ